MAENKKFLTRPGKTGTDFTVYLEGGGEVPKILSGVYTSVREAKKSIDLYLLTRRTYATSTSK
jgi:hypothetical protein